MKLIYIYTLYIYIIYLFNYRHIINIYIYNHIFIDVHVQGHLHIMIGALAPFPTFRLAAMVSLSPRRLRLLWGLSHGEMAGIWCVIDFFFGIL